MYEVRSWHYLNWDFTGLRKSGISRGKLVFASKEPFFGYANLTEQRMRFTSPRMKFRMSRVLRFWVDVEYERIRNQDSSRTRAQLIPQILREFEEAGEAMRYLDADGRLAWKATPEMLSRLADAEQEARDDELAEWS
jgi:hypothetical protein